MSGGGELRLLRPDVDDAPLRTKPKAAWCPHARLRLDTGAKRAYCAKCSEEIPPFDALLSLAQDFERYVNTRAEAARQATVEQERLEDLRRRIRNARSVLRRAEVKREADLPNEWWREFDRALRRGHARTSLSAEAVERIALIHAEQVHPGGRDA